MNLSQIVRILIRFSTAPTSKLYFRLKPYAHKNPFNRLCFQQQCEQVVRMACEIVNSKRITHKINYTSMTRDGLSYCIEVIRINNPIPQPPTSPMGVATTPSQS